MTSTTSSEQSFWPLNQKKLSNHKKKWCLKISELLLLFKVKRILWAWTEYQHYKHKVKLYWHHIHLMAVISEVGQKVEPFSKMKRWETLHKIIFLVQFTRTKRKLIFITILTIEKLRIILKYKILELMIAYLQWIMVLVTSPENNGVQDPKPIWLLISTNLKLTEQNKEV